MTKTNTFANIVAENYSEIKRNFISGLKGKSYKFDEDILSDTFISCNTSLKDKLLTKEDAIKYFWTSYINKLKSQPVRNTVYIDEIVTLDEDCNANYDDFGFVAEYDNDIDDIYNYILDKLYEKFGEYFTNIWKQHVCDNKKTNDLIVEYSDSDLNYQFKKIRRYIDKLLKTDNTLMEMIKNFK